MIDQHEKNKLAWQRLKIVAEKMQFGEMKVIVHEGRPVRIENVIQRIKLDDIENEKEFEDKLKTVILS
jgi:hypothetical protein